MSVVFSPTHAHLSSSSGTIVPKKTKTPTPYALAAAFTAEDNGAIDPGDNPVAFFTQLSDVFLDDEGIFFLLFRCAGVPAGSENFENFEFRVFKNRVHESKREVTRERKVDNANAFSSQSESFTRELYIFLNANAI